MPPARSTTEDLPERIPTVPRNPYKLLVLVAVLVALALPSNAQRRGISVVRDAEIEALIKDYARPLMKAGGLRRGSVRFYIVNDNSFNAFVSGRGMFIHAGLLLQSETPDEAIGVIAHELGHIIGGHQARLADRVKTAQRIAKFTTLLGIGLGAAGAASGSRDLASAGFGVVGGGQSIALRNLLSYRREEETSADRAAVSLLRKTKQSGIGMLKTFKRLAQQQAIQAGRIDPYMRSHPVPRDRIRALESSVRKSPFYKKKPSAALQERHDMARAKIAAYLGGTRYAQAVLNSKKLAPDARIYGRAIIAHLYGSPKKALSLISKASKLNPKNAYLHEMRGEILLRSGKGKKAATAFAKAVKLDRYGAGFLRVELGHALLESGTKANAKKAIVQLKKGLARDPTATAGYGHLARAYSEVGDVSRALLASAELAIRTGKKGQAKSYAKRAQKGFKRGSPGWLRSQDIITYK